MKNLDLDNLDQYLSSNFDVPVNKVLQYMVGQTILNSYLLSEVMRKVIALEHPELTDEEIDKKLDVVIKSTRSAANDKLTDLTAKWHLK